MYAMKFAHLVRERVPDAKVYESYIDIRAFGKGYEEFYKRVLEEDVLFVRGKCAQVSNIYESPDESGKLIVSCEDTLLGVVRRIPVDMVVLATALEPRKDSKEIARLFSLPCGSEGWFLEKHPKLAPVATATAGVFLAGACQGPKDIPDSVAQGAAAAAEVLSMIDKGFVPIEPTISEVDEETCTGCKVCLELCPYKAIEFNEEKNVAHINEPLCLGCGVCVAACPTSSIQQKGFTDTQILAEVEEVVA